MGEPASPAKGSPDLVMITNHGTAPSWGRLHRNGRVYGPLMISSLAGVALPLSR
jgi:hypothetical protein